ncbi:hypothetical protein MGU_07109 [Metarhizium guizhouense ARSEF 977]|uniref:Uncharacterized protein n=1 Tax=Metarhizium guizhouense (strain ARSEF 977) TaxID=1276136 RepID=A0A0B4H7P8_METGA|nr:hypothetical protein MGU_07109 [Metarhizium guizhouense ARSEF 977]
MSWNPGEEPETIASTKGSYDMMANSHKFCVEICGNILKGVELDSKAKDFLQHLIRWYTPQLQNNRSKIIGVDILSDGRFVIEDWPSLVFNMQVLKESIIERWEDTKRAAKIFKEKKNELSHLVLPPQTLIRIDTSYLIVEKRLPFDHRLLSEQEPYCLHANNLTLALEQLTKFIIWTGFRYPIPNRAPVLDLETRSRQQRRIGLINLDNCGVGTMSSRFIHDKTKTYMKYNKYKKHAFVRRRKLTLDIAKKSSIGLVKKDLTEDIKETIEEAICERLVRVVHPQHFDIIYEAAMSEGVDLKTIFHPPWVWERGCKDRLLAVENGQLTRDLLKTTQLCVHINAHYFGLIAQPFEMLQTVRLELDFDIDVRIRAFRSDSLIGVLFANENSKVVSIIVHLVQHLYDAPAVLKSVLGEEGEVISSVKRMSPAEGLCLLVKQRRYGDESAQFVKIHRESGFPITTDWSPQHPVE